MLAASANDYRQRIKDAVVSALRARDDVSGCWEGGSATTGRLDEFSDVDLVIVAPLDRDRKWCCAVSRGRTAWSAASTVRSHRADRSAAPQQAGACSSTLTRLAQLRGAVPVFRMLVEKELARGHPIEAYGFHQVLLRALIELLGMQHRPDRFDYGWRYVETEFPKDAQQLIERYAFIADTSDCSG